MDEFPIYYSFLRFFVRVKDNGFFFNRYSTKPVEVRRTINNVPAPIWRAKMSTRLIFTHFYFRWIVSSGIRVFTSFQETTIENKKTAQNLLDVEDLQANDDIITLTLIYIVKSFIYRNFIRICILAQRQNARQ